MEIKSTVKYILVIVDIVIVGFLLQTSIFPRMRLAGVTPNIMVIIITSFGLIRGRKQGMMIGFFSGLLLDFFSGTNFGFYAIIYLYLGFLCGLFKKLFFGDDIKLPLVLIGLSDVIYGVVIFVLLFLLRGKYDFLFYLTNVILPEAVYTILIAIPIYYVILKINQRFDKENKRSARKLV